MNDVIESIQSPEELERLLGERIRRLRLRKNFTQDETARRAGLSRRSIFSLENGRGGTIESLVRVLKALDSTDGIATIAPEAGISPLAVLHSPREPKRARRARREQ
ncbi:MAG TPA: helix-turn-helix transcriptional regulator [Opitutaceae bacterium]|nr:helix-turn-helix transcriptional regulator [Opitutaceae bacterium]